MKKIIPILFLMLFSVASAQTTENSNPDTQYGAGAIQIDKNGKISFSESINAEGLTANEINTRVTNWFNRRFKEPTIIGAKKYESTTPGSLDAKVEEYIVFKKKALVLDRSRISYILNITSNDGVCNFKMSRITYLYDEEAPEGAMHMKAEEWITDKEALNKKGKLKKFPGKFRRKTIDLKNQLIDELKNELTK